MDTRPKSLTRPARHGCLKITPPITPELSAASSPCDSGRTSPALVSDSGSSVSSRCGRKTVSFCPDDDLEEIFFADEWDRTPAAVTPKLSYQDILELKQLRINLPYSPPPPTSRQPFTTSSPAASKPPFPVSRFASTASHTPSKWKNRSEPQCIDPEILPYLGAVPIRLLPLLPQSPTELEPEQSAPDPPPQTPTPTASPEARPFIQHASDPPELRIEPVLPIVPPRPPPHHLNIAFTPLLPVQDPPPIPPPPVVAPSAPSPPRRKFNMTFLPVNSAPDLDTTPPDLNTIPATAASAVSPPPLPSVAGTDPSPSASRAFPAETDLTPITPTTSTSGASSPMSPPSLMLPYPATSVYPYTTESDTETDIYTDTDGESDAPSTSVGSSLPSPPCEYEDDSHLDDLKMDSELVPPGYFPHIRRDSDPGSYFPPVSLTDPCPSSASLPTHVLVADAVPSHSSKPGQTPPLSVLYPFPQPPIQEQSRPSLDVASQPPASCQESETPVIPSVDSIAAAAPPPTVRPLAVPSALSHTLQRKIMLEALPSPALMPPSPFELEPPSTGLADKSVPIQMAQRTSDAVEKLGARRIADSNTGRSFLAAPALSVASSLSSDGSPLLTLESIRAAWDAQVQEDGGCVRQGVDADGPIGPSLSRRRSRSS